MPVETVNSRVATLDAIEAVLASVAPPFAAVIRGKPYAIAANRTCAYWYSGDNQTEEGRALGSWSTIERFRFNVFWRLPESQDGMTALELEKWDTIAALEAALFAGHGLDGLAENFQLYDAQADLNVNIGGSAYELAVVECGYTIYDARGVLP